MTIVNYDTPSNIEIIDIILYLRDLITQQPEQ